MNLNCDEVTLLAAELIECPSVCPEDGGAQGIIEERLRQAGFGVHCLNVDGIKSLFAVYGSSGPLMVFSGHSDVVPPGDIDAWMIHPFRPEVRDGNLYGRGAIDMKGPLAASVVAAKRFVSGYSPEQLPFRLGFIVAGDEEVMANHGTLDLLAHIKESGDCVSHCIVTESTSKTVLGDMVKIGRRGSMVGELVIKGVQGHSAYPQLASNPISKALEPLGRLANQEWGEGVDGFPPTTLQITNVHSGTGAANVIPGELMAMFNFRFSPEFTAEALQSKVEHLLEPFGLEYTLKWSCDAHPFLTKEGLLSGILSKAIRAKTGLDTEFSTSGGTSDARFVAPTGAEVIEFGTLSGMCHQVDEHVSTADLQTLASIYEDVLKRFAEHYQVA